MYLRLAAINLATLILVMSVTITFASPEALQKPRTFVFDSEALAANKASLAMDGFPLQPAIEKLIGQAEKALLQEPVSVVEKEVLPPSGDRHDYMSIALYAWPNPNSENGLPYIRKDGEVSPMAYSIPDKRNKNTMLSTVETLSLTYYFTGDDTYAEHAALMLRTWFIDEQTRMNPNLNYAQAWPGISEGRYHGIIDTAHISMIPDYVGLLEGSEHWTDADQQGMEQWCADYLAWLTTSIPGKAEGATRNNHGSWWDCQVVALALFCEEDEIARDVLEKAKKRRIVAHIAPDGSQPKELGRTKSWDYSVYNLRALFRLAQLGRAGGVDLWGYHSEDGRSLVGGLDYLLQYADHLQDWPHKQIYEIKPASLRELLLIANSLSDDIKYSEALVNLHIAPAEKDRQYLVYH